MGAGAKMDVETMLIVAEGLSLIGSAHCLTNNVTVGMSLPH